MTLTLNYDLLMSKLNLLTTVLRNNNIASNDKNILFQVAEDKLQLYAFSPTVTAKVSVEPEGYDYDGTEMLFHLPNFAVDTLKSSFASEFTTAETVTFTLHGSHEVSVSVIETVTIGDDVKKNNAEFVFKTVPVEAHALKKAEVLETDVEFKVMTERETTALGYLASDLTPYIPDRALKTAVAGFKSENVVVVTNQYYLKYKNLASEVISTGGYNSSSLSLLQNILNSNEGISYAVDERVNRLFLKLEDSDLSIVYDKTIPPAEDLTEKLNKANNITLHRHYFSSILSRIRSVSREPKSQRVNFRMNLEEGLVEVSTPDFNTSLPLQAFETVEDKNHLDNGLTDFEFYLTLPVLDKAMFGKDGSYADDLKISFDIAGRFKYAIFYDSTGAWQFVTSIS